MKKFIVVVLPLLMWSNNVFSGAHCTTTITASTPTADFLDNGDGTVTHTKTGLMWKKCSEGLSGVDCLTGAITTQTWQAALQLAETLNSGGGFATYTDWRLPNLKELALIIEEQCSSPAINVTIFPGTQIGFDYWSSSPDASSGSTARHVSFLYGQDQASYKSSPNYVRLVRGGS